LACLLAVLVLLHPAVLASVVGRFLLSLLFVNVVMVLFNLLPAFPMDGGRVLRSLLAMRLGQLRATRIAAGIGAGMALLIGLGGTLYLGNPWLMVIAFFVFMAGQAELQAAYAREYQRGLEPADEAPAEPLTPPLFSLQSHITVYTWDAETRQWVKAPTVRSGRVL
ncbi:MAG TPA: site-2 protease family protein, partial [Gemmataceae bacterium]|nr:site-2 protease family protein [Gemmataceae bacterium]